MICIQLIKMWLKLNFFALTLTALGSGMACLSLNEIHSSSQTFKSIAPNHRDESLKNAIETIHRRRQEYPFAQIYGPYSVPVRALEYYRRVVPFSKNHDQEVLDVPLEVPIDVEYTAEPNANDLFTSALALKLTQLLDKNNEGESDVGHRVFNRINSKHKRSAGIKESHSHIKVKNAMKLKSNDFKNVKQNAKQKSKAKAKRSSGRRVLNDHFNIEENINHVFTKKSLANSKSNRKHHKMADSVRDEKMAKKSITKRKVETQTRDKRFSANNTEGKQTTDKTIVTELNAILSDDNRTEISMINTIESKAVNKSKINSDLKTKGINKSVIKKKNKRSNPLISDKEDNSNEELREDIIYPTEGNDDTNADNDWPASTEAMEEWLRKEYYENIAKALATMRRKRSEISDILSDDSSDGDVDGINGLDNSDAIADNLIAIDESNDNNDNTKSNEESIDYVVAVNDNNEDTDDNEEQSEEEKSDSDAWDDIPVTSKQKRSVSTYFGQMGVNEETNDIDVDSNRFNKINDNLESIEDSLLKEAIDLIRQKARSGEVSDAETYKIENRLGAAYDLEDIRTSLDNFQHTIDKINDENSTEVVVTNDSPQLMTTTQFDDQNNDIFDDSLTESEFANKCFGLELLSGDCSSVSELMPNSRLRYSLTEACNWHHICYICGELYGLLSSECDAGFLEASRLACDGSPSCESFARLVLSPLRQSRVFYKSTVPQTCFQYECIKDFLFDTQNTKR